MSWLRAFRTFIRRLSAPGREPYLREHERERELGMQQIREMTKTKSAGNGSDHRPKK